MDSATYKESKTHIKQLTVSSYAASYGIMALNLLLLAAGLHLWLSASPLLYIAGIFVLAFQMNHAYLIVHESGHGSFLKGARPNEVAGVIFSIPALLPFYARRYEHAVHHRYTGSFEEPSTARAMRRFSANNPRTVRFLSVCWKLWVPVFAINEHVMLWKMPFERGMARQVRLYTILEAVGYGLFLLALFAVLGVGPALWLLLSFMPVLYVYMMLIEFFNLPHHMMSPIDDHKGPRPYNEQAHFSKSCAPMPRPIGNLFLLNFNYHIAHHLYPALSWMRLPEAHSIMVRHDASLNDLEHEWALNRQMRGQPFRIALSKYFDHQYQQSGQ